MRIQFSPVWRGDCGLQSHVSGGSCCPICPICWWESPPPASILRQWDQLTFPTVHLQVALHSQCYKPSLSPSGFTTNILYAISRYLPHELHVPLIQHPLFSSSCWHLVKSAIMKRFCAFLCSLLSHYLSLSQVHVLSWGHGSHTLPRCPNLCSSCRLEDLISYPYKPTDKIIKTYNLIWMY